MAFSPDFADFVVSQMEGLGEVTVKKMFGEAGLYHGTILFAMIADDVLYFKARDELAAELGASGQRPFTYHGKSGRQVAMPYWTAPASCLDDPGEMSIWCKKIVASLQGAPKQAKKSATKKR